MSLRVDINKSSLAKFRRRFVKPVLLTLILIAVILETKPAIAGSNANPAGLNSSYTIYSDGTSYYALNVATGAIDYSGTDAATVINNAIVALTAGGTVLLKSGTYTLSRSIVDAGVDGVTICGEGWGTVLKIADNTNTNAIKLDWVSGWIVRDLAIDGNKANQPLKSIAEEYSLMESGVYTVHCPHIQISNCRFSNCRTNGVLIIGTPREGTTTGVRIIGNVFIDNGWNGLTIGSDVKDVVISDNSVQGSSDVGISSYGDNVLISNNIVSKIDGNDGAENSHWAIASEGNTGTNLTITRNEVRETTTGIVLSRGSVRAPITISGNVISARCCIWTEVSGARIVGNTLTIVGQWNFGIRVLGNDAQDMLIENNQIFAPSGMAKGIYMDDVDSGLVEANTLQGDFYNGVRLDLDSEYCRVVNNQFQGTGTAAINIASRQCIGTTVADNTISPGYATALADNGTNTILVVITTTTTSTTSTASTTSTWTATTTSVSTTSTTSTSSTVSTVTSTTPTTTVSSTTTSTISSTTLPSTTTSSITTTSQTTTPFTTPTTTISTTSQTSTTTSIQQTTTSSITSTTATTTTSTSYTTMTPATSSSTTSLTSTSYTTTTTPVTSLPTTTTSAITVTSTSTTTTTSTSSTASATTSTTAVSVTSTTRTSSATVTKSVTVYTSRSATSTGGKQPTTITCDVSRFQDSKSSPPRVGVSVTGRLVASNVGVPKRDLIIHYSLKGYPERSVKVTTDSQGNFATTIYSEVQNTAVNVDKVEFLGDEMYLPSAWPRARSGSVTGTAVAAAIPVTAAITPPYAAE